MKRTQRVVILLVITALMTVIVAMTGASSAFSEAPEAIIEKGKADAHGAGAVEAHGG